MGENVVIICTLDTKGPETAYLRDKIQALGLKIEDSQIKKQLEIQAKYAGYIERQALEIQRHLHYENTQLPTKIDYNTIAELSVEVRQKLTRIRPETIGIASRIPGVTPSAISVLLIYLKKWKN